MPHRHSCRGGPLWPPNHRAGTGACPYPHSMQKNIHPRTAGLRKLADANITRTATHTFFKQEGNEEMGIILGARLNPVSCGNRNQRAERRLHGLFLVPAPANRQEEQQV